LWQIENRYGRAAGISFERSVIAIGIGQLKTFGVVFVTDSYCGVRVVYAALFKLPCGSMTNLFGDPSLNVLYASGACSSEMTWVFSIAFR
jgi:hypothetical protein